MKRLTCILSLLLFISLSGCSSSLPYNTSLDLHLSDSTTGLYGSDSASIHGRDLRPRHEVVYYHLDSASSAGLANITPPHELFTSRLTAAFQQQGLQLAADAPVTLTLAIQKLQGVVTRPKALYKTDVKTTIRFIVNNRGATLTKDYFREENQESLTRPDLQEVEAMLEEQAAEILESIIGDTKIRSFIQKKPENHG